MKQFRKYFILVATSGIALSANAQKLPNKQEASVRAPANIKIDGKATEWDNKFQAFNKATDIYYTLSNDDDNLYLTVQATLQQIKDKIIRGGISLTIIHTVNKTDKDAITITYPVLRNANMALVANMVARKSNILRMNNVTALPADATVDDLNQLLDAKSKLIDIIGIKPLNEESISVYNSDGIKSVSQFDRNVAYTYELAVPLKYLNLPNGGIGAFSYHVKVNEPAEMTPPKFIASGTPPPPPPMVTTSLSPTDFWGQYTLAKK